MNTFWKVVAAFFVTIFIGLGAYVIKFKNGQDRLSQEAVTQHAQMDSVMPMDYGEIPDTHYERISYYSIDQSSQNTHKKPVEKREVWPEPNNKYSLGNLGNFSMIVQTQNRVKNTVWTSESKNFNPNKYVWVMKFLENSQCIHQGRLNGRIVETLGPWPYKIMGDTVLIYDQVDSPYPDYENVHLLSKDGLRLKNISIDDLEWHWHKEKSPGVLQTAPNIPKVDSVKIMSDKVKLLEARISDLERRVNHGLPEHITDSFYLNSVDTVGVYRNLGEAIRSVKKP